MPEGAQVHLVSNSIFEQFIVVGRFVRAWGA